MRHDEQGFTLLEVLVALIVTGLLLAVVFDGLAGVHARARLASAREDAARLGEAIIARAASGETGVPMQGTEAGLAWRLQRSVLEPDAEGTFGTSGYRIGTGGGDEELLALLGRPIAGADPHGLYALSEYQIDVVAGDGRRLARFTKRRLERVATR